MAVFEVPLPKKLNVELVFATSNEHKAAEVAALLSFPGLHLLNLSDLNCHDEIEETGLTFQENALLKARYVHDKFGVNVFADDSGLEIEFLDQAPGIYSARFAGPLRDDRKNNSLVLEMMAGVKNRKARFVSSIALIFVKKEHLFEGIMAGEIAESCKGKNGFGYDPLFIPEGFDMSFAEMTNPQKNQISHRYLSIQKMEKLLLAAL